MVKQRYVAAKMSEPLFLRLKTILAGRDLSVQDWIQQAAALEVSKAEYVARFSHLENEMENKACAR